jgi:hypothetical protein
VTYHIALQDSKTRWSRVSKGTLFVSQIGAGGESGPRRTYRRIDAASIISGISRENPALDFDLYIAAIWSAYEVIGDTMINTGATKPATKESTAPMMGGLCRAANNKYEISKC